MVKIVPICGAPSVPLAAAQRNTIVGNSERHAPRGVWSEGKAAEDYFDRETGEPVPPENLKSYRDALAQYHLHPEAKSHNGDYLDSGVTGRRHIVTTVPEHIGKEANRWEEPYHLGLDAEAQTEYGTAPSDHERILEILLRTSQSFSQSALATAAGVSLSEVSAVLLCKRRPTPATLAKLYRAIPRLEREASEAAEHIQEMLDETRRRCQLVGVREFARQGWTAQIWVKDLA